LRDFLELLERKGLLEKVSIPLSTDREISSVLLAAEEQAFLFQRVKDFEMRVAGNLYCTKANLALGLGLSASSTNYDLSTLIGKAVRYPSESIGSVSGFQESEFDHNEEADLSKLPILKHFDKEAGRYITAGIVVAKSPESGEENLSVHRMLVLSKNKVVARIVPRHLARIASEMSPKSIPVSVVIGPPPSVFLSAALQIEYGTSEYRVASKLSGGKLNLMKCEHNDLAVPIDSELVLEGELMWNDLVDEGPFVDLTRTYDEVRKQPTITFRRMHFRNDSTYQVVVGSSREHSIFMGFPQELKILDSLSRAISKIRGVNLTQGGNGYFHCIVSLDKVNDGDGKTAIMSCFAASHPLKLVIAVDSDIDPFDLNEVEWALATRFQADRGLIVINGARGSSLDPSSSKSAVTSKLGIDATLPVNQDRAKFKRATISTSDLAKSIVEEIRSKRKSILG
jgi:UbiD family decarboxylase